MSSLRSSSPATLARRILVTSALTTGSVFLASALLAPQEAAAQSAKKKKKKAADASAQPAAKKKSKKGDAEAADSESKEGGKSDKKDEPKPEDEPLKRQGAASLKVDTAIDQKTFARTQQADQKRDEAIEELKKLIPKAPSNRKSEMIFRLAELYWEKSKFKFGLEMTAFDKAYTDYNDGGRQGKEPTQKDYIRESELIKQNALKLYEKVLTEYPTYERNDEVLFYLGYNEYEAGNKKAAVSHYWTLIKQFPQSRLLPDAYLQLGEHFFNDNNVAKARTAFERALATNAARIYNYALYKLAWCDYNVQEYQAGIHKLKEVIDKSEKADDAKAVQLKGEALGDLARFFSYVDEVETAFDYFKKKGGEEIAIRYTTRLGGLFEEQGKWPLEIKTYRMLNEKYAMNTKAPELQSLIVKAYSKLGKKDMVRKEVERLVDLYRPGTPWYEEQKRKNDKASLEYAYDLTESNLRDLVTEYHADAQKRQDISTYQLARDIYRKYLDAFSDTESAYQMRFFYAEVLWALKEWKNAAEQYDRTARVKIDGKARGKYARTAAFDAILAWEKIATEGDKGQLLGTTKIDEKANKGAVDRTLTRLRIENLSKDKKYTEEGIPEPELKLSQACDLYFDIADQKDKDLPAIKFKAAYLYYKHNHFVEAAQRYNEIIERWPGDDLSKKSANLILDSLNVQERWEELEKYARGFKENKKLVAGDKKFAEETQELVEGASFKSVLVAEKKARDVAEEDAKRDSLDKVATRFRSFQKEFPESKYADKAVFNAVTIYDKADELDHAIEAAEILAKKYEKSDLGERAAFLLAGFYERIADFDTAANLYSKFYDKFKKSKKASDALYNAGVYYQGLGNSKKAIEKFELYTKEFADNADAPNVYWRTCEIREEDKQWKQVVECYGKFRDKYKKASPAKLFESRYRIALALEQQKQHPQAVAEYKWLVANYGKLPAKDQEATGARLAGAHAAFELLDPEYVDYSKLKITLNKKTLLTKATKADDLACVEAPGKPCKKQGKFLSILGYKNGDYGIAALTRMGQVYRGMADSIRNAPLPARLDEDQIEIYRAELDNVALGPEEKAIEAFENALKKAYELNIYNRWTLEAQSNLKELNPNKFPDLQKRDFKGAEEFYLASVRGEPNAAAAPEKLDAPSGDKGKDKLKGKDAKEPKGKDAKDAKTKDGDKAKVKAGKKAPAPEEEEGGDEEDGEEAAAKGARE